MGRSGRPARGFHDGSLACTHRYRPIFNDQTQFFGVDVVQIAVDVYVLRCPFRLAQKPDVVLEGRFIVTNSDVGWIIKRRDIGTLLAIKGLDQPFWSE